MGGSGQAPGVVVLGAHRSGTSAVTGAVAALGLIPSRQEDRFPVRRFNARGNFESRSVSGFDELLLRRLGGAWWAPPGLAPGWASSPGYDPLRAEASAVFSAAYPESGWVWKDPRASVLMQFWDRVLGPGVARIVVVRNPFETADSLFERNGMPRAHALALTERTLRACLLDSAGRPTLLTSYDEAITDGEGWCRRTAGFLGERGLGPVLPSSIEAAAAFFDRSLQHHDSPAAPIGPLWRWALERRGTHESLDVAGLPEESPATELVLAAARDHFRPAASTPRGVPQFGPAEE